MNMTFKRIWEVARNNNNNNKTQTKTKPKQNKRKTTGYSKVCTNIRKKAVDSSFGRLLPMDGGSPLGPVCRTQVPWAFTIGGPQVQFFSGSQALFHFFQLGLFSSHYFISSIAKLPLLEDKWNYSRSFVSIVDFIFSLLPRPQTWTEPPG